MYLLESSNPKINEIYKANFGESLISHRIIPMGRTLNLISDKNQIFEFEDNISEGFKTSKVLKFCVEKAICNLEVNGRFISKALNVFIVKTAHSQYKFLLDDIIN